MGNIKNIILMADGIVGLEVTKKLVASGEKIVRLYLHDNGVAKLAEEIKIASECKEVFNRSSLQNQNHIDDLRHIGADFIITVYWAHLLSPEVISCAVDTLNFHPALLPINRGWFPHVHSILDGSSLGVTLHRIENAADTGPIWVQKEVQLSPYDTAKTIYDRLQNEMIEIFNNNWPDIKSGKITPKNQRNDGACYHKKSEIAELDELDIDTIMPVRELINILRARSFGDLGFAFYEENGARVYLKISLSDSVNHS
jgi:methionyl-tRNA formyltransferase